MHMYMYMHAADKEWKRKFFQEKKFTSTLEDRIKRSKDDLQQLQSQADRKHGLHIKGQEVRSGPCLYNEMMVECSLVPRPSPQCVTLKNWEWPGYEARWNACTTITVR